jgi:hypothetical protein
MSAAGRIVATAGPAGIGVAVIGGSAMAVNIATVLVAAGAAAALVGVGYGAYYLCTSGGSHVADRSRDVEEIPGDPRKTRSPTAESKKWLNWRFWG